MIFSNSKMFDFQCFCCWDGRDQADSFQLVRLCRKNISQVKFSIKKTTYQRENKMSTKQENKNTRCKLGFLTRKQDINEKIRCQQNKKTRCKLCFLSRKQEKKHFHKFSEIY